MLLIENEAAVTEAMILLLERWGCDVAAATSGAEAVEKVKALGIPPQVVIADLHLNNGELGPQAIQYVRDAFGEKRARPAGHRRPFRQGGGRGAAPRAGNVAQTGAPRRIAIVAVISVDLKIGLYDGRNGAAK